MTLCYRFFRAAGLLGLALAGLGAGATAAAPADHPRNADGFAYPALPPRLSFPRGHASHPDFRIEWWYITGHLFDAAGGRYGFQATFFRNAGPPAVNGENHDGAAVSPRFGRSQIFLAHMAVMDLQTGAFYHQERIQREGWDAGAATDTLRVFNGNWILEARGYDADGDPQAMRLVGTVGSDAALDLVLDPRKGRTLFGDRGVSKKGPEPDAASYYITFTRLGVNGTLQLGERELAVTGSAWMDHEISSNQLDDRQVGWDWVQMQLDDGSEIMAYRLRRRDGSTDPYSFFNWIDADGEVTQVGPEAFRWDARGVWTSPDTGGAYPIAPVLTATHPEDGKTRVYRVVPLAQKQEILGDLIGISYWEGAVDIEDADGKRIGRGYLELTGYAQDLSERL